MTIRINQNAVDFTLEQETTFAELARSLGSWASSQNWAILGILADGKALASDDPTPLSTLHEIDVEVVDAQDQASAKIGILERYFSLVAQGAKANDRDLLSELRAEYSDVRNATCSLLEAWLGRMEGSLKVFDGPWEDLSALAGAAVELVGYASTALQEVLDPRQALADALGALESDLDGLEELGTFFHRGRDKDAFGRILGLFTLLGDAGRRAQAALSDQPSALEGWRAFSEDLQPFLRETEQALASGDYILLTDLLEYEVTPRLRALKERASRNFQP